MQVIRITLVCVVQARFCFSAGLAAQVLCPYHAFSYEDRSVHRLTLPTAPSSPIGRAPSTLRSLRLLSK